MELKNFIFQAWKVMEFYGRFWKVLENCKYHVNVKAKIKINGIKTSFYQTFGRFTELGVKRLLIFFKFNLSNILK